MISRRRAYTHYRVDENYLLKVEITYRLFIPDKGDKMFKRNELLTHIMNQFYGSFINAGNELILEVKGNVYFRLEDITCDIELKCKLLEWVSRHAVKSQPYTQNKRNERYQDEIRYSINRSLSTKFSREDMELIYDKLGNQINRELTINFIQSDYDVGLLS